MPAKIQSFKQHNIDLENAKYATLQEKYKTSGWMIETTPHARGQSYLRHKEKTAEDWQAFHRNIVHGLIDQKAKSGIYLLFSLSHNHGVVADVNTKKKSVRYITTLPTGAKETKDVNDIMLLVEAETVIDILIVN